DKLSRFKQASSARSQASAKSSNSIKAITSNEDDEEEEEPEPKKKGRAQSKASSTRSCRGSRADDDDFIIPKDSEVSYSGAIDIDAASDFELDDQRIQKSKYKPADEPEKKKSFVKKPTGTKSAATGSQSLMLTVAEQRALEKNDKQNKQNKQNKEDFFSFLVDVRDKDKNCPGDPNYDSRTLYIPPSAWKNFTPIEKQFWEIKQNYFDTVSDILPERVISLFALKQYAAVLSTCATANHELNKIYTNGTLVDADLLMDDEAGDCVSIREDEENNTFGICVLDSATSQFDLSSFVDDVCRTKLETVMRQLRPKEIIFTKGSLSVTTTRLFRNVLDSSCLWNSLRPSEGFKYDEAVYQLKEMFPDDDDAMEEGQGLPEVIREMLGHKETIEALGGMIWYLRQLNIDKDLLSMKNFNIYDPMKEGKGLILDGQTLAHIEVLVNSEGTSEGSLLSLLGRCVTPFGKRLFRLWLCMPLKNVEQIMQRQDAVQDLVDNPTFEAEFAKLAKGLPDLERTVSRIHAKNCKVKEFLKVIE
ncbi:hypothetical protein M422DRAFT_249838, partial [Sphaerobolus stellatus SS14]